MRELYEQLISGIWVALHHRWSVAIVASLVCLIGWGVVYLLPDKYEVKATVYFDSETALSPVLKGIATEKDSSEERVLIIQRTLTNRVSLQHIAESSGMQLDSYSTKEVDNILAKMFRNIKIVSEKFNKQQDRSKGLYGISYSHEDPLVALAVVNSTLDLFIEKFIKSGRSDSEQVESFLDGKIEDYKNKLESAEEKLKLFKQKHPDLTQDKGGNFFNRLNQLKKNIEDSKLLLIEEKNKNYTLRNQLNRVVSDNRNSEGAGAKAVEMSLLEQRILSVRQKLAELNLQFTDRHPDVQANERILKQLIAQKEQEDRNPGSVASATPSTSIVNSVLYQDLQLLLSESNTNMAVLKTRISEYQTRFDKMNKQVGTVPEIEAELVSLARDYSVIKDTYDGLVKRKASSGISSEAEMTSTELLYQILDHPSLPTDPSSPNRKVLSTVVLLSGFIVGLALAWLLEQFNPKIYREQQIKDQLELEVYGNIPMYWTPAEIELRRVEIVFYSLFIMVILAGYLTVLIQYGLRLEPYIEVIKDIFNQRSL